MDTEYEKSAVLVVDDDPFLLATSGLVLERNGRRQVQAPLVSPPLRGKYLPA